MARFYYYVVTSGTQWEVKFDGQKDRYIYATQASAIEAAAGAARAEHDKKKIPTGVRIQDRVSQWRDERTYGDDPFPPHG